MQGFFLHDLKRSFLNRGFFAGLIMVTWILVSAAFHAPLDRSRSSYFIMMKYLQHQDLHRLRLSFRDLPMPLSFVKSIAVDI